MPSAGRLLRPALAGLLVLSAVGFALATNAERAKEVKATAGSSAPEGSAAQEAAERGGTTTTLSRQGVATTPESTTQTSAKSLAAPEGSPTREAAERARRTGTTSTVSAPPSSSPAQTFTSTSATTGSPSADGSGPPKQISETLFGVHTESPATTAEAVVVLVGAAFVVLRTRRRWPLVGVAVLAGVVALLDAREAVHQHQEGRSTLVAAAAALAVAHLTASLLSVVAAWSPRRGHGPRAAQGV